jgi:hypothetical protein
LTDDLGEQRRALLENRLVDFQANDGIGVGSESHATAVLALQQSHNLC